MIIAICGAQSTGKTTIVDMLESMGYITHKLVARTVMKDHPINKDGDDGTQAAITRVHMKNLDTAEAHPDQVHIMDRCLLDGLVYTVYGCKNGKVSIGCLDGISEIVKNNIKRYDYIVYLKPEFDIVKDGIRSTDVQFRDEICEIYENLIQTYGVKVIIPTGSPEERVNTILTETGLI